MKKTIIGIALIVSFFAAYGQEAAEPFDFGSIWLYFCLADSSLLDAPDFDTVCSATYGNWYGSYFGEDICNNYILQMWARDSSAAWRFTQVYECTTSGFNSVVWTDTPGEYHIWFVFLFTNLNTYEDGSPWTAGFTTGDSLLARISVSNPGKAQYDGWTSDPDTGCPPPGDTAYHCGWRWDVDPAGDVFCTLYVLPQDTCMGIKEAKPVLPQKPLLGQNSPNPFNATTEIFFSLPTNGHVKLEVTDILGKHVATLVNADRKAGDHIMRWIGTDDEGNEVPSGVYFYKLTVGDESIDKKKMTLIK